MGISAEELSAGLARVCARVGLGALSLAPQRLTGGAVMESWRFACGDEAFVLRRAPSLAFMEGRPYGHSTEAALIEAARAKGVTAPEVVARTRALMARVGQVPVTAMKETRGFVLNVYTRY